MMNWDTFMMPKKRRTSMAKSKTQIRDQYEAAKKLVQLAKSDCEEF